MSAWKVMALCACGEAFDAWRGDLFFVRVDCCPKCGTSKSEFEIATVRWTPPIYGSWRQGWPLIQAGFWERKDTSNVG